MVTFFRVFITKGRGILRALQVGSVSGYAEQKEKMGKDSDKSSEINLTL